MARLTVAEDWDKLKPWAEEIVLADETMTKAAHDVAQCEYELGMMQVRLRVLEARMTDAQAEARSARLMFHKVFAEMLGCARAEEDDEQWLVLTCKN